MAVEEETHNPGPVPFFQTPMGRNFILGIGVAVVLALMAAIWMWSQAPEYRVLFANFNDRDGGSIVAALDQMNVPHKFAEGGGAILIPANMVHDTRLKLAAQGLPKGGNVGFELMENQKLGVSQFLEQVNFQRALEGELARSIQSLAAVQSARIHLALPKPTVFVRDQQKPTASVILNLHPGRSLDPLQTSAIVHLIASSVPELTPANVTIVDQAGNLLSDNDKKNNMKTLDPNQLKYIQLIQQNIIKQVESIVVPIVGTNNVRAEATADVDFSQVEQAAETFTPNQPPDKSSVRSQQLSESQNGGSAGASGVPGALSNQPPTPSTAPVTTGTTGGVTGTAASSGTSRKDSTINYEVDKTVRYTQQPMGGVKRLSVAVVVNYKRIVDKTGKVSIKALTAAEKTQITDLVKEAMGYNQARGDTLNVLNTPFDGVDKPEEVKPETPWWKDPENIPIVKEVGKFLMAAIALSYLFFRLLRPMMRPVFRKIDEIGKDPVEPEPEEEQEEEEKVEEETTVMKEMDARQNAGYRENLQMAKNMAKEDPRVVANVVKAWVGTNE